MMRLLIFILLLITFPAMAGHLAPPTVGQVRAEPVVICKTLAETEEFFTQPAWKVTGKCLSIDTYLTYRVEQVIQKASINSKTTKVAWIVRISSKEYPEYVYAITY